MKIFIKTVTGIFIFCTKIIVFILDNKILLKYNIKINKSFSTRENFTF
jgi:hypothetical protein